jgi:hypothetical protein
MAFDGAGKLFYLAPEDTGYSLYRWDYPSTDKFELVLAAWTQESGSPLAMAVDPAGNIVISTTRSLDLLAPDGRFYSTPYPSHLRVISLVTDPGSGGVVGLVSDTSSSIPVTGQPVKVPDTGQPNPLPAEHSCSVVRLTHISDIGDRIAGLRNQVLCYAGNSIALRPDLLPFLPVWDRGAFRVFRVGQGRGVRPESPVERFLAEWHLSGGIAADGSGAVFMSGTKRPMSAAEARSPSAAVFRWAPGTEPRDAVTRFGADAGTARLFPVMAVSDSGDLVAAGFKTTREGEKWAVFDAGRIGRPRSAPGPGVAFAGAVPLIQGTRNPALSPVEGANPTFVRPGGDLVIEGINFARDASVLTVTSGELNLEVAAASTEALTARFPKHAPGGDAEVRVTAGGVGSNAVSVIVKTPLVDGLVRIGTAETAKFLASDLAVRNYSGTVTVTGVTDSGRQVNQVIPVGAVGLGSSRLPNGRYMARFRASYDYYVAGRAALGITVPEQVHAITISDDTPVAVFIPVYLAHVM